MPTYTKNGKPFGSITATKKAPAKQIKSSKKVKAVSSPAKPRKTTTKSKTKTIATTKPVKKELIIIPKNPVPLTPIRSKPLKPTDEYQMRRMNHEAFHIEFGEYKVSIRFELISDENTYRRVLHDDGKEHRRFNPDKIGMVYCTRKYFYRVPTVKTRKGYKFEEMGVEYAKMKNIYEEPVFLTPKQAEKEINKLRKGLNPLQRMTTKFM